MIDTTTETHCKNCGKPIIQTSGHRRRDYCNDTCKQTAYRLREEHPHHDVTNVDERSQQRIAELEQEVQRLQEQLNIEQRFRTDTQVHHFKSWLRTHRPAGTDFAARFLDDRRLPPETSRSRYEGLLRLYQYSDEDIFLFRELWKDMLFLRQQS